MSRTQSRRPTAGGLDGETSSNSLLDCEQDSSKQRPSSASGFSQQPGAAMPAMFSPGAMATALQVALARSRAASPVVSSSGVQPNSSSGVLLSSGSGVQQTSGGRNSGGGGSNGGAQVGVATCAAGIDVDDPAMRSLSPWSQADEPDSWYGPSTTNAEHPLTVLGSNAVGHSESPMQRNPANSGYHAPTTAVDSELVPPMVGLHVSGAALAAPSQHVARKQVLEAEPNIHGSRPKSSVGKQKVQFRQMGAEHVAD